MPKAVSSLAGTLKAASSMPGLPIVFAAVIAGSAFAGNGLHPPPHATTDGVRTTTSEETYFYLLDNEQVETMTCATFMYHADLSQYGSLTGSDCVITAPFQTHDGADGNISIHVKMTDGSTINVSGCQEVSHVALPGYYTYSIDCTYQP